ncbi:PAS domain S-box protein [Parapedobacter sp. DT-150]|uniref:PAS domain-containing sensor histidine kinase n=1 Tax=Parapedobacter sp. DT-150 TaxID=3396162 RepID=UPI003F1CAEA3
MVIEDRIQDSYKKWLIEEAPIAMYTCDHQGFITYFNEAAAQLWGREPVIGQDAWCGAWKSFHVDGSIMTHGQCPMAKVIKHKTPAKQLEMIIERPDGTRRKILVHSRHVHQENGLSGGCAFLIDITYKDEQDTKQAILSSIIASSDDAIISKNLDGIITSWNKGAQQIFGYTEKEAIGKPITILIPKERIDEETHILSQIRSGKKVDHFRTVRLSKTGEEIHVSLTVSPVKNSSGRIVGASKIARDITKQANAEAAIRLYASNLEAINSISKSISEKLDVSKIMQYVVDATTNLTGAAFGAFFYHAKNEEGKAVTRYALSGISAAIFEGEGALSGEPVQTQLSAINLRDIRNERHMSLALDDRLPEKQRPVVSSYLQVPVTSSNGLVVGELFFGHPEPGMFDSRHEELVNSIASQAAIALDNSKLFDEVKSLSQKKDEFIALASHELKTPLTSIGGFLQILQKKSQDPLLDKFIHKTIKLVEKLNNLVSDLLDVSRVENTSLPFHMEAFDCRVLVMDVLETFRHTFADHRFLFDDAMNEAMVFADKQRIEQVLTNLLDNAIKYSPQSNNVYVSLVDEGDHVQIKVRDEGTGMNEEQRAGLFTRFYRVEDSRAKVPGLGLGLFLSKQIIAGHGGQLLCQSELGSGSEFYFTVPKVATEKSGS